MDEDLREIKEKLCYVDGVSGTVRQLTDPALSVYIGALWELIDILRRDYGSNATVERRADVQYLIDLASGA
jgi:hypothetical protein